MKKIYFILAVAATFTFSSCMNDEFIGDNPSTDKPTEEAIAFGGNAGKLTRATSNNGDVATMLDSQMKIYGVKGKISTDPDVFTTVFGDYLLWNSGSKTASNPDGDWEYVGAKDEVHGTVTLQKNQYIRYWDHSTEEYHFVAGSPVASFNYTTDSNGDIESATVSGLGGHINPNNTGTGTTINPVYIATPVKVKKGSYNSEVTFSFNRQQAFVRVGIYETIPGYKITNIEFYTQGASDWATPDGDNKNNIILASETANYFSGASNATATVSYTWGTTPSYSFGYTSGLTSQKNWYGGKFANGVQATSASGSTIAALYGSDDDLASTTGYFTVIPTPSSTAAAALKIKCNYDLESLDGVDKIQVTGATATIPSDYTKWAPNTAYTYLFKISDNTNGTTGSGTDPVGLYPITFDAAVVGVADQKIGTETTVSTPSITVYQDDDVVGNGITYKAGSVTVKAYEGATDVTDDSNTTWSYVELASFNYASDYEHLGASGADTSWTSGALTSVTANNTYVIKAATTNGTAYFVLVVGAAENGPAN